MSPITYRFSSAKALSRQRSKAGLSFVGCIPTYSAASGRQQIGLALQSYHDGQRSFPPGYVSAVDAAGNDTGPGWGWAAKALPYMEQGALFDSIRLDQPIDASVNSSPRVAVVKSYRCPSDSV